MPSTIAITGIAIDADALPIIIAKALVSINLSLGCSIWSCSSLLKPCQMLIDLLPTHPLVVNSITSIAKTLVDAAIAEASATIFLLSGLHLCYQDLHPYH